MARNTIKRPFLNLARDPFADMVEAHLSLVLPNIAQSQRLGDLDKRGIDVLQFDDDTGDVVRAVQCKGYERPFNADHVPKLSSVTERFATDIRAAVAQGEPLP